MTDLDDLIEDRIVRMVRNGEWFLDSALIDQVKLICLEVTQDSELFADLMGNIVLNPLTNTYSFA